VLATIGGGRDVPITLTSEPARQREAIVFDVIDNQNCGF
jgi:hypothetical protein